MPEQVPDSAGQKPSVSTLFRAFNGLALQSFGGALPLAHRELVERRQWLTRAQFLDMLALAQTLPGPNIVNLALMIGDRFQGARGAAAAVIGVLAAPLVLVLLLAVGAQQLQQSSLVTGALRGVGVVAAGLIWSMAYKLAWGLRSNRQGLALCALWAGAAAVMVGLLRWPLVPVVLGLGALSCAWSWRMLGRQA